MIQSDANSYRSLRQTVGALGLFLPLVIFIHTRYIGNCPYLQDSISHYFYTNANVWFIGIFWGLALVLLFYPSYPNEPKTDGRLTTIAGILAFLVSLFPTRPNSHTSCAIFALDYPNWVAWIHFGSASIMLLIFSYMSIAIFTKTDKPDLSLAEYKWKRIRNKIYIICGLLTFVSLALAGLFNYLELYILKYPPFPKYTFWFEVGALVPFGFSWLIKGEFAFTDENEISVLGKIAKWFKRLLQLKSQ